jgi:hypothetical protein
MIRYWSQHSDIDTEFRNDWHSWKRAIFTTRKSPTKPVKDVDKNI